MNEISFNYKDMDKRAKEKYPENVSNRYAFKDGVLWAIERLFPDKDRDELFEILGVPRITLD